MILRYISPREGKPYLETDGQKRIECVDSGVLMVIMHRVNAISTLKQTLSLGAKGDKL